MLPEIPSRMKLGTLDRLRSDPIALRKLLLRSFGGATIVIGLLTVILVLVALTSSEGLADRLAWAAVVFAGATLLLAGIAAVVALLAYAVSTGLPDIEVSLRFPFSRVNNLEFVADLQSDGRLRARQFKQTNATVLLQQEQLPGKESSGPCTAERYGLHARHHEASNPECGTGVLHGEGPSWRMGYHRLFQHERDHGSPVGRRAELLHPRELDPETAKS